MILTKEREDMEKENKLKSILKNLLHKVTKFTYPLNGFVHRIVKKVHALDPRDNTQQRVISALILIPLALYAIFYSKSIFLMLAIAIAIIMTAEWMDLIHKAENQNKWRLIGLFYILIPIYSVIKIRYQSPEVLLWMFLIIWATDIFAFFAGRTLGGMKLMPSVSPNKTWSGLIGGVAASAAIGFVSSFMFNGGVTFFVTLSIFLSVLEQVSDLLESKFKRIFGVKDSGNIIPGHGGILDRLDGMMLVAPFVLFLITVLPGKF
jgi:phosphatidate cytidylyltransferase